MEIGEVGRLIAPVGNFKKNTIVLINKATGAAGAKVYTGYVMKPNGDATGEYFNFGDAQVVPFNRAERAEALTKRAEDMKRMIAEIERYAATVKKHKDEESAIVASFMEIMDADCDEEERMKRGRALLNKYRGQNS